MDGNVIMSDDVIVANGSVAMADVAIVIASDGMIPTFVNHRIVISATGTNEERVECWWTWIRCR